VIIHPLNFIHLNRKNFMLLKGYARKFIIKYSFISYQLPIICLAISILVFIPRSLDANENQPTISLSNSDKKTIERIEKYMNEVTTLKARFVQTSPENEDTLGTFYLKRPGKLRVEYDPPVQILIVGDGFLLHFLDNELGQVNDWPIFDTPLGALSDKHISFNDKLQITHFDSRSKLISLRLIQKHDPGQGGITLFFTDSPLALKQWIVDDAQGLRTKISLFDVQMNTSLNPELFIFNKPEIQHLHTR